MNNTLQVTGKQNFMGKEIPVVLGGFGPGKKCISDKTIAEIHEMETKNVRARITDNLKRFHENVDYVDLAQRACEASTLELLTSLGYAKQSVTQAEHIYILSERGYAKLIKIMDTDTAWAVHDKLMDEYFELRENSLALESLSPELRLLINLEVKQREQEAKIESVNKRLDETCELIALDPVSWRKETQSLIARISDRLGGIEHIRDIHNEIYKLLESRAGVNLKRRLENKRRRMADEGISKARREKIGNLDVIAEDKKLIEVYVSIVKQMAVKYGVGGH